MTRFLVFLLFATSPAWSQSVDSSLTAPLPAKSNFKSSFLLEPGLAYAFTGLPAMRAFFRANQIDDKTSSTSADRLVSAGFGFRRHRVKAAIHSFLGLDRFLLPPDQSTGTALVARRQNISGLDLMLGYDVANTRNKRVFVQAGVGSIRYEYTLFRATSQPVPFQSILQSSPAGGVPSLFFESGFWEINVEIAQREKRRDALQWVSRLGYRRSFQPQVWQSDAYPLLDAPMDRIGQLYVMLGMYISRNKPTRPQ